MVKLCTKCGAEKEGDQFYADKSRATGLSDRCRACITIDRAAYREANRERLRVGALNDRTKNPERGVWQQMIARCHTPGASGYEYYGARGIAVSPRWRYSFENFLADMGQRPSADHSIDRYPEQMGNYEPGNCRWATRAEQSRNRTDNRMLTAFGRTQCLTDWAAETGLNVGTLGDRIDLLGWETERALTEDAKPMRRGLTAFGETHSVAEWARIKGVNFATLLHRLDAGWSPEKTLSEPPVKGRPLSGKRRSRSIA